MVFLYSCFVHAIDFLKTEEITWNDEGHTFTILINDSSLVTYRTFFNYNIIVYFTFREFLFYFFYCVKVW
jgi:hypothetical protein